MEPSIYHIYDKLFKKILTLSSTAVVNLINGLFNTNYPTDSTITYNWTEFEKEDLRKILADTILTINGRYSYHMEAQMEKDETIILRVFDYSYSHAVRNATGEAGRYYIRFPEPKVIYLYSTKNIPDEYVLDLDFGKQGVFHYSVSVCKFQEISTEELNDRKMVILIPFALLKVRELLKKKRSPENLELLKKLIQDDIIKSIDKNLALGNITVSDAQRLRRYTHKLYKHVYSHFKEMEVLNEMTDESLMLDIDIIEKKHEEELYALRQELEKELKDVIADKDEVLTEKNKELDKKDKELDKKDKELSVKDEELIAKDKEIERLKAVLANAGIQA